MAPKKPLKSKIRRNGSATMYFERQNNYLKRKKSQKMKKLRKKKDRLKYLWKKTAKVLTSKERQETGKLEKELNNQ